MADDFKKMTLDDYTAWDQNVPWICSRDPELIKRIKRKARRKMKKEIDKRFNEWYNEYKESEVNDNES